MKCKATKRFLDKHDLPYREGSVEDVPDLIAEHGLKTAPVVVAPDGKVWGDFRLDLLEPYVPKK